MIQKQTFNIDANTYMIYLSGKEVENLLDLE